MEELVEFLILLVLVDDVASEVGLDAVGRRNVSVGDERHRVEDDLEDIGELDDLLALDPELLLELLLYVEGSLLLLLVSDLKELRPDLAVG